MYTKESLEDILKCFDPENFINRFGQMTPLQREWLNHSKENIVTQIGEERFSGRTHFISAYALWSAMFIRNHNVAVFCGNQNMEKMARDTIGRMYESLQHLRIKTEYESRRIITFENGSKITFGPVSMLSGRGMTINSLLVDGIENVDSRAVEGFLNSTCPTLCHGKIISTGRDIWPQ